ncbi:O-antigen ligase family protein [Paenibacillus oryzisoli]|uniref:O-antigen ligase family protein n=1 Tax=Paenibacillus oryzisoli TaxID=1850517 RepID=UPI003D2E3CDD
MSVQLLMLGCLSICIFVFFLQCVMQLNLKLDAGWIFGFSFFFDLIGFLYKKYVHGSSLFLLLALPFVLVGITFLHKKRLSEGLFTNKGLLLWFLFLSYSIISLGWAFNDELGFSKLQILFIHGIIPGIYTFIVYKKYKKFSWTSVVLFGLAYSITHHVFALYTPEYPGRLTLPGGNPIFDARILFGAVTIAIWGKQIPLVLRVATIGFGIYSGIATQSRGPLLALVIANVLVLIYVLYKKYKNDQLRISKSFQIGALLFLIVIGFVAMHYKEQALEVIGGSRFTVLVNQSQLTGDANFLGRKYLQINALNKFVDHPFFGTGLGGDSLMGRFYYPHNIILEIASELGLIGITLWGIAFLYSCYIARFSGVLLVLLIQSMVSALFSGDYGYNYEYLLVAITALALAPKAKEKDVDRHGQNYLYFNRFRLRRSRSSSNPIGNRFTT